MTANFNNTPTKCGTYAGVQSHKYRKEKCCEACKKAKRTYEREYLSKNKEKLYQKKRIYRKNKWATDPIFREKVKNYSKTHPEQRKKSIKKWIENNKEQVKLYQKNYAKSFPEKAALRQNRRRAKKLTNGVEPYTLNQVLELYGTDCHICTKPIDLTSPRSTSKRGWQQGLHIDHVIPIASGGPDTIDNVRPAHALCNMKKGARMSDFEPEIDVDLFDEDLLEEIDHEFDMAEDYDDHAWDEEELVEEEE